MIAYSSEMAALLLLFILSWIAGNKASRLLHAEPDRLRRAARSLVGWAAVLTAGAFAVTAAILSMAYSSAFEPLLWIDRLALHLPLVLIPTAALWLTAVPRLMQLSASGDRPADDEPAARAGHPAVAAPFRWVKWGALAALYFVFVPPVPLDVAEAALPLLMLFGLSYWSWIRLDMRFRRAVRAGGRIARPGRASRLLRGFASFAAFALVAAIPIAIAAQNSRLPDVIDMSSGPMDFGGDAAAFAAHAAHGAGSAGPAGAVSVVSLTGPRDGEPDRRVTLTAERKTVALSSGRTVDAWTYNGRIPGPELRFKQGELVEIELVNRDIEDGVTIHWHGLDVPNAEDGVAGATQDAVMPGESHTYRFRAEQAGTFWYHSHQNSKEAVQKGLFGPLVVEPADTSAEGGNAASPEGEDIVVISHMWDDAGFAIGADDTVRTRRVAPGTPVRMRLINTDDWVRQQYVLSGTPFRVAAIDGTELNEPGELSNVRLLLTTGGRYDLTFTMPDRPVFLSVGRGDKLGVLLSPDGADTMPPLDEPAETFDPLAYGERAPVPFGPDSAFDRSFLLVLDNKLGFYDGQFEQLYTMNGKVFPDAPMLMVREGDLVKTTIVNRGAVDHPMHLHGHHVLVLSRNGKPATGSPWWSDTLDVQPGETYEIAFRADNPGLWMDHCHNLTHAAIGMTMHLMYEGVSSPFHVGRGAGNHPE